MQVYFLILYFFTYGFLGWCTEVAYATIKQKRFVNRGFLNGPICPIYGVGVSVVVHFLMPVSGNLFFLYLSSTVLVTVLEGLTGYFMDKIFHHKWWDYSNQPLYIGGYVCFVFSLVWGIACVVIVKVIHPVIHDMLALFPLTVGVVLIVFLLFILSADLYVTASEILKFNRQLEMIERIAEELREVSDRLGETIHENVMETMEQREKVEEHLEEQRKRIAELREHYEELLSQRRKVVHRLMSAFPGMESRRHKAVLEELKAKIKGRL